MVNKNKESMIACLVIIKNGLVMTKIYSQNVETKNDFFIRSYCCYSINSISCC